MQVQGVLIQIYKGVQFFDFVIDLCYLKFNPNRKTIGKILAGNKTDWIFIKVWVYFTKLLIKIHFKSKDKY